MPSFRPPCIHEAHFRHRGAPVSGSLRPSATVAAWHPGPAALVRGKASIPPGVACVHPCPENGTSPTFSVRSIGVNRPGFLRRRSGSRLVVFSPPNCSEKPPPRLKYQSQSRPDWRHAGFHQTPRRRISDNAIYVMLPLVRLHSAKRFGCADITNVIERWRRLTAGSLPVGSPLPAQVRQATW